MLAYTALVSVAFSVLALFVRPGMGLGLVVAATLVWPEYLRISMGVAEMSAPRLVALTLFIRYFINGRALSTRFLPVDYLVLASWFWGIFAAAMAGGEPTPLRMVGAGLDTVLIYFVARWSIGNAQDLKAMTLPLLLTAFFMCAMGVLESTTYYSPYQALEQFRSWEGIGQTYEFRLGFLRAKASTSVSIFFGMAMMLVAAMLWSVRDVVRSRFLALAGVAASFVAAFTSLSSGPWIGCATLIFFNSFYKRTSLIKPALWALACFALLIEIASDRHFYHMINYLGLSGGTAWYRTRLLEVMLNHLNEYWLFGMGGKSTDHWIAEIGGQASLDIVNHFLVLAFFSGLMAMFLYLAAQVFAIRLAVKAFRSTSHTKSRKLIFGFAAGLVALNVTSLSVGLFGPPLILSNILLGASVTVFAIFVKAGQHETATTKAATRPQSG
ncbi:hypothetical protein [Sneathiella chinensis]|uniref:O-antigen ligase domain-containing protein n=1 Tax=Sneathiella chinensis TaxID=349750 RepID=A0ABQ5U710_9PROT|nr:hypothetical protein [Sneathiella chinensis]GLQ07924.1 hypothetical protein GCM10007924_31460 [Sneathiella chinensis]